MADKCTMFDQYPCDRLTSTQRELEEATRLKAQYREQYHGLLKENAELKEQLERARSQLAHNRGLVLQALELLNEVNDG